MAEESAAMSLRRKLLAVFALTVLLTVTGVAWLIQAVTRNAFEKDENRRTAALVSQFQSEFNRQGEEVVRRVDRVAGSEALTRMAAALGGASVESAEYLELARSLAESHQLDFLEVLDWRGNIVSSAQWPAKYGYPDTAFETLAASAAQSAFLKLEEMQDSSALGLFAVRTTRSAEHPVYVAGGRRLDKEFLSALNLAPDVRVLPYQNRDQQFAADLLIDPSSSSTLERAGPAEKLAPLVQAVRRSDREMSAIVNWSSAEEDQEVFHAIPLRGVAKDRPLLGILLVGHSRRSYVELKHRIRDAALLAGGGGIVLAVLLGSWAAARVTRPVEELAAAAQEVAVGRWGTRVEV